MAIRFFDMFAGIGGFRSGLEAVGGFECVGHCEIDPYVHRAYCAMYDTEGEIYFEDARTIDPDRLPDIDLICGGFPCQSFSIAGRRKGFADDARGTLFFEIARIARAKRPTYLLLENVPGLLSHDEGRTFATILNTLSELGYDVIWSICNSKDFGVAQSRRRVFIVGFLRERCRGRIPSSTVAASKDLVLLVPGREGERIYSSDGVATTLTSSGGSFGGKTGIYLTPTNFIDMSPDPKLTDLARCITARQDSGVSNRSGEHSAVFCELDGPRAVITPERDKVRQQGRRIKNPEEPMFTLTVQDRHGVLHRGVVRKLTPLECFRLQGFTDGQFERAQDSGMKNGRLYKAAGNAVTVPVVSAWGRFIKEIEQERLRLNYEYQRNRYDGSSPLQQPRRTDPSRMRRRSQRMGGRYQRIVHRGRNPARRHDIQTRRYRGVHR